MVLAILHVLPPYSKPLASQNVQRKTFASICYKQNHSYGHLSSHILAGQPGCAATNCRQDLLQAVLQLQLCWHLCAVTLQMPLLK